MKPTELRIGNLVDVINRSGEMHVPTGVALTVIAVGLFDIQAIPNEIPIHEETGNVIMNIPLRDVCGIPLTIEWLTKFGLSQHEHGEGRRYSYLNGYWSNQDVDFVYKAGYLCSENYYSESFNRINKSEIKFVHEFQNIWYAITNEELTINS
jgi:hypothetical protein